MILIRHIPLFRAFRLKRNFVLFAPRPAVKSSAALVALVGLVFLTGISGRIADLAIADYGTRAWQSTADFYDRAQDQAEYAIYLGGIEVSRSRNAIAGSGLGCAAGAGLGAGFGVIAGLLTGGAGFAAIPGASAMGCGLGMMGGMLYGRSLDSYAYGGN
jgi:hypothetical protein